MNRTFELKGKQDEKRRFTSVLTYSHPCTKETATLNQDPAITSSAVGRPFTDIVKHGMNKCTCPEIGTFRWFLLVFFVVTVAAYGRLQYARSFFSFIYLVRSPRTRPYLRQCLRMWLSPKLKKERKKKNCWNLPSWSDRRPDRFLVPPIARTVQNNVNVIDPDGNRTASAYVICHMSYVICHQEYVPPLNIRGHHVIITEKTFWSKKQITLKW